MPNLITLKAERWKHRRPIQPGWNYYTAKAWRHSIKRHVIRDYRGSGMRGKIFRYRVVDENM